MAHAPAINEIYRTAMIPRRIIADLADRSERRLAATQYIKTHGGFISPPEEFDMELSLNHGFIIIAVGDGAVVGFNRIVTDAHKVRDCVCKEFRADPLNIPTKPGDFKNWSGSQRLNDRKTLKRINWVDKEQAAIVFNAAETGVRKGGVGLLAWAVDSAVHPSFQRSGVAGAMSSAISNTQDHVIPYRAFRMFELLKVNGQDVHEENLPSKNTFITQTSKLFAFTEEEIKLSADTMLLVRWNQWIKCT